MITSSCRCTIGRLSLSSHWALFLPFVAQVYFAQYTFPLPKTDRVRRCLSTHHWHNRVMRVSVCRYNISISHLQYPWGFSRVSYITILLIFPFRPYQFVVFHFLKPSVGLPAWLIRSSYTRIRGGSVLRCPRMCLWLKGLFARMRCIITSLSKIRRVGVVFNQTTFFCAYLP